MITLHKFVTHFSRTLSFSVTAFKESHGHKGRPTWLGTIHKKLTVANKHVSLKGDPSPVQRSNATVALVTPGLQCGKA